MKILHTVESYSPSVGGMQEVVKVISEQLVKYGHSVTVATSTYPKRANNILNGVRIIDFDISGNMVRGYKANKNEIHRYQDLLKGDFDIVTNFAAQQWATDLALIMLDKIKAKKVFVPTGFSGLYLEIFKDYFKKMPEWMSKYDNNVFLSEDYRDINLAKSHNISKISIIPNGASKEEFEKKDSVDIRSKLGISNDDFMILHVGSHTGQKGHKEAIKLFNKVKINNVALVIVANSFGRGCSVSCKMKSIIEKSNIAHRKKKKLIITSLTRNETVSAYHQADLFLFPSNIECSPIVLFEAMASKTPFLSTDVGNASEVVKWSNGGMILPTIREKEGYVRADVDKSLPLLENIILDKSLRNNLAKNGNDAWRTRFTWEKISLQYELLYTKLST